MGNKETLKDLGQPVIEGWLGYEIINETMFFGRMSTANKNNKSITHNTAIDAVIIKTER